MYHLVGNIHRFGDNINTDLIISVKRKRDELDPNNLKQYAFESIRPGFSTIVSPGDFIVAGNNFGCGSSREIAPQIIKAIGIEAVVAKTFSRIFYRNSFNCGLFAIEVDTDLINDNLPLEILFDSNLITIRQEGNKKNLSAPGPGPFALNLLSAGGLLPYLKDNPNLTIWK